MWLYPTTAGSRLCEDVEERTVDVGALAVLELEVELLPDFDELWTSTSSAMSSSNTGQDSFGACDLITRSVVLNERSGFLELSSPQQVGVLMHEVGHAYAHRVLGEERGRDTAR